MTRRWLALHFFKWVFRKSGTRPSTYLVPPSCLAIMWCCCVVFRFQPCILLLSNRLFFLRYYITGAFLSYPLSRNETMKDEVVRDVIYFYVTSFWSAFIGFFKTEPPAKDCLFSKMMIVNAHRMQSLYSATAYLLVFSVSCKLGFSSHLLFFFPPPNIPTRFRDGFYLKLWRLVSCTL